MNTRVGAYELLEPLGAGAMGQVYVARDTRDDSRHALKLLPPDFASDPDRVRRFEQEARAAARVVHPHVLRLRECGTHQGAPYIVSELLEGETLKARLARGPIATRGELLSLSLGLAEGVAALHAAGVVHRDLKPENLFLARDGQLKILDLGLARVDRPEIADATLSDNGTTPGTILGTAGYMAPEQVRGLATDARSDVFAVGAILYELAAGQRAFPGETAIDRALAIVRDAVAPLSRSDLPDGFGRLIEGCLAKDPAARVSSASAVAEALRALATEPSVTHETAALTSMARPRRAQPSWLALAWLASVLLAIGVTRAMTGPMTDPGTIEPTEPRRVLRLQTRLGAPGELGLPGGAGHPLAPLAPAAPLPLPPELRAASAPRAAPPVAPAAPPAELSEAPEGEPCDEACAEDAASTHAAERAALEAAIQASAAELAELESQRAIGEEQVHGRERERAELQRAIAVQERALNELARGAVSPPNMLQVIAGDGRTAEVECTAGDAVTVTGHRNTVVIRGPCGVVSIAGEAHHVSVESSELLVLTGYRTRVRHGPAASGRAPRIIDVGVANDVEPSS